MVLYERVDGFAGVELQSLGSSAYTSFSGVATKACLMTIGTSGATAIGGAVVIIVSKPSPKYNKKYKTSALLRTFL